jgi:hypothetical protein
MPHVTSADVWEAIHRESGLPIVADYYTRVYPVAALTLERASLFDALCRTGDKLGSRWKKDGPFLLCRSTSYFWNKQKEVPNRLLQRWRADRRRDGFLPFEDLMEMAALTDAQLDSRITAQGIRHCWAMPEWEIVGGGSTVQRSCVRFLTSLRPEQRRRALTPQGVGFGEFSARQREEWLRLLSPPQLRRDIDRDPALLQSSRLRAVYVPAGWYTHYFSGLSPAASTAEAALAAARRISPGVAGKDIQRVPGGDLLLAAVLGNGNQVGWGRARMWQGNFAVRGPDGG